MSLLGLTLAYLRQRPVAALLSGLLLALGVATVVALLLFGAQMQDRLTRDAKGIELVVGAKGSPLQLVLSAVYHADIPTGNILLKDAKPLLAHPQVRQAIPLALGDSVQGVRIVGTDHRYPAHY
ncbi:MAG: ABC transporter permease, partial [Kiloniellales bacterium]|nr:ABC transporter permease [Kiloniellales bacterium]